LDRVQGLADEEAERRVELAQREREGDKTAYSTLMAEVSQCDGRTQALALLTMFLFTALHLSQDQIEMVSGGGNWTGSLICPFGSQLSN